VSYSCVLNKQYKYRKGYRQVIFRVTMILSTGKDTTWIALVVWIVKVCREVIVRIIMML